MSRWLLRLAVVTIVMCFAESDCLAQAVPANRKIEPFTLRSSVGGDWSFGSCKDAKAIVVVFVGTECPVNTLYFPRLAELHHAYAPRGVAFVGINANAQDSMERIASHAKRNPLPFPILKDSDNRIADRFGAEKTPEAFLLDASHNVCYRGRIDDQYGIGYKRGQATNKYLIDALEDLLAGKIVARPQTVVEGCYIGRVSRPKPDAKVTYARDVAPILQKKCQGCHRPGEIGPMALGSYDDASAWAETIRTAVEERRMPPWHADPRHLGEFANERHLSDQERATVLAWIDQGCAPGKPEDKPPPRDFTNTWQIGKPDVVLSMPVAYTVPAKAARGISYKYAVVPTNFSEDRWIQAAEARPGSREVVHHILVYVRAPDQLRGNNRFDGIGDGMLAAYAPGDIPSIFPAGTAKKLPKGGALIFQLHYTPDGTERKDLSSVGLIFAKEPPANEAHTRSIAQRRISIPPGESSYKLTATTTFPKDTVLLSFLPHMHLRGKSFEYRLVFPDGKTETVLSVPHYDFNWQTSYRLAVPRTLPAGTRIDCTAYFDNSANNKNNPDPTKTVRWGEQTWDEMMIGFVDYYQLDKPAAGTTR